MSDDCVLIVWSPWDCNFHKAIMTQKGVGYWNDVTNAIVPYDRGLHAGQQGKKSSVAQVLGVQSIAMVLPSMKCLFFTTLASSFAMSHQYLFRITRAGKRLQRF
jgi:hypothetical protein